MSPGFQRKVPTQFLLDFLRCYCTEVNDMFLINDMSYKFMCFSETSEPRKHFCSIMASEFYTPRSAHYATREFSYNSLTTMIRHICNSINHPYATKLLYEDSTKRTIYYVSTSGGTV